MSLPATTHPPATVYRMQPAYDFTQERRKARHDNRLQPGARLLFEDVCELSERDGFCNASQEHFAGRYDTDERTIRRWEKRLEEFGYVRSSQGSADARRRRLTPCRVESTGHNSPVPGGSTGQSAQIPDISRHEIPDISRQALRVYKPLEGEREARAQNGRTTTDSEPSPEQPERPDDAPTLEAVKARAAMAGVPAPMAEEFFWYYEGQGWTTGGANPRPVRNWQAKLMQWKLRQPSFETAPASGKAGAPLDLAEPIERDQIGAALAHHPTLSADDFHDHGKDWRGKPMVKLSLAKRQALGVSR